jgi:hypothetical protein
VTTRHRSAFAYNGLAPLLHSQGIHVSTPDQVQQWSDVLKAGAKAQRIIPGAVAVGGTAASLYAHHRFSQDTYHLLPTLKDNFQSVRERLESAAGWKTARLQPPVLILGSLDGIQVGFRQARRITPIESTTIQTPSGPLTLPTLDEMVGMKAYLAYSRNALRDYLDFAALSQVAGDELVLHSLLKSDQRYGHLQSSSVAAAIAKALSDPRPYDLDQIDLADYKGLVPQWRSWDLIALACRRSGQMLAAKLVLEGPP